MAGPVTVYLGLGGNLGDRLAALTEAVRSLAADPGLRMAACSSVYETEPWGVSDQPRFLNLVAVFETTLSPVDLLMVCQSVEATVGRTVSYRWGPRLIDVDILLYGEQVVNMADPDLQIPHPRMTQRAFVLAPLAEIAPDLEMPSGCDSVPDLLAVVPDKAGVVWWATAPSP